MHPGGRLRRLDCLESDFGAYSVASPGRQLEAAYKEKGDMAINEDSFESRIGKGTKISGKLNFRAPAKIEGEVDGEISGDDILIAQGAVVTARIAATRLTVAGQVSGEIVVRERLELLPTARLKCAITTPSLVLNEGAQFEGDCKMPRERAAA
jgi:cytoskeletal protein CcmA (bactofilin family)